MLLLLKQTRFSDRVVAKEGQSDLATIVREFAGKVREVRGEETWMYGRTGRSRQNGPA